MTYQQAMLQLREVYGDNDWDLSDLIATSANNLGAYVDVDGDIVVPSGFGGVAVADSQMFLRWADENGHLDCMQTWTIDEDDDGDLRIVDNG